VCEGGARSVMHSYADVDGVPPAADHELLTGLLRDDWGFEGTVVADYFGITFLQTLHRVADSPVRAAGLALAAGVDVELPTPHCYGEPLLEAIQAGLVTEEIVDAAAGRVLRQKGELGLLDPDWRPVPPALELTAGTDGNGTADLSGTIDLDPPHARAVARDLAEQSVVLLSNNGILPLRADRRIALVGRRRQRVRDARLLHVSQPYRHPAPGGAAGRGHSHAAGGVGRRAAGHPDRTRRRLRCAQRGHQRDPARGGGRRARGRLRRGTRRPLGPVRPRHLWRGL